MGMRSRKSRLWSAQEREKHGKKMAELREEGITLISIGNQYGVSENTIRKTVKFYYDRTAPNQKEANRLYKKAMIRRDI
jgi:Fic family protein